MKVLIIGSGGREHALGWKIASSPLCDKVYFLPGNGGTGSVGINIGGDYNDFKFVKDVISQYGIDMLIVGPEDPLARGITDYLSDVNVPIIGPKSAVAFLEASKIKAKFFMKKHGIPTADFEVFEEFSHAVEYIKKQDKWPVVIKADGLCKGKGVEIVKSFKEAYSVLNSFMIEGKFQDASRRVVIEEYLKGYEFSVFAYVDGDKYTILGDAIDYKPVFDNDKGPNTGGMGSISPCIFLSNKMKDIVREKVIEKTITGIKSENLYFRGFLYFGLMWTNNGPYVLEYNIRMGDPETQVIVKNDERDWLYIFENANELNGLWPKFEKVCVNVVLASKGYPGRYEKGFEIKGLSSIKDVTIFHAGTKLVNGRLVTWGGRVLNVVGCAKSLQEAREKVYKEIEKIHFNNMFYRKDIGDIERWKGIL